MMEQILKVVKTLREKENFNGYIHTKTIPGTDDSLIEQVGKYVDRMSVNIELPSEDGLKLLAPKKTKQTILQPMRFINNNIIQTREEKKIFRFKANFVPAGQTTQMIIGATGDTDRSILHLSESLYENLNLKRVYYSAFIPISNNPKLPILKSPPLVRENRIYQADWLLRFYKFKAYELLDENKPNFDLDLDPKCDWALRNMQHFPVEINKADYNTLLRVPGIGVKSAMRILSARKFTKLDFYDLKKLGIVLKRAQHFIICNGKYYGSKSTDPEVLKLEIIHPDKRKDIRQISMFEEGSIENKLIQIGGQL